MIFRGSARHDIPYDDNQQVDELLQHMGMITQHVDQGLAMVDLQETICFINMACAKMHGYKTSNELLGKKLSTFHRKEKVKTDLAPLVKETKLKGMSAREVENVRADGTSFPTQMKMILARDKSGRASALIVIITDITERKQLQRMLVTEKAKQDEYLKEQIEQLKNQIAEGQKSEKNLRQQADELAAANEQLKNQITESRKSEEGLRQRADELAEANEQLKNQTAESQKSEKNLRQQADELAAANEQLKNQVAEGQKSEKNLRQQADELAAANEQLRHQITEYQQSVERLQQEINELKAANERYKGQIADLKEGEKKPTEATEIEDESEQTDSKLLDVEKLKSIAELAKRLR